MSDERKSIKTYIFRFLVVCALVPVIIVACIICGVVSCFIPKE